MLDIHNTVSFINTSVYISKGFPGGSDGKDLPAIQETQIWVGKIPWRREWLPTPVFLPREFPGQTLEGYSP